MPKKSQRTRILTIKERTREPKEPLKEEVKPKPKNKFRFKKLDRNSFMGYSFIFTGVLIIMTYVVSLGGKAGLVMFTVSAIFILLGVATVMGKINWKEVREQLGKQKKRMMKNDKSNNKSS